MNQLPKYSDLFLPVLLVMKDGQEKSIQDIAQAVIASLGLDDELLEQRLNSGTQRVIDNRIGWARTYLNKANLIERTSRGIYRISEQGIRKLQGNPSEITLGALDESPEFKEWRGGASSENQDSVLTESKNEDLTPEEQIDLSVRQLQNQLRNEIVDRVKQLPPEGFEQLVLRLLVGMGYGGSMADVQGVARGADGGVDGVVNQDHLGLDRIYIQAKRWEGSVGRPVIQGFVGALAGVGATKGVIMTTSSFAQPALDFARNLTDRRIVLVDGKRMADLMMKHQIGVSTKQELVIQRVDEDFFMDLES
jgi:restriction system protein